MAEGVGVSVVLVVMGSPANASTVSTSAGGGSDKGGDGDDVVGGGSNPLTILLIF